MVKDERGIEGRAPPSTSTVRAGEIVGIAGIDGNGQKELVEAITCLTRAQSGTITVNGEEIQNTTPRNVIDHKVSTIHEDRQRRGLVLPFTVREENAVLEKYRTPEFGAHGVLDRAKMHEFTEQLIHDYDVRPPIARTTPPRASPAATSKRSSSAARSPTTPTCSSPSSPPAAWTWAIEYVHKTLVAERDRGTAILLISLELDEVMSVADTIAVIYAGAIVDTFKQGDVDENRIGLLMAGGHE